MAIYAIGDVQGCFNELQQLLTLIHFNPKEDVLWLTGDLVNRGPQSLDVLRFIKSLGNKHQVVLGNHDLHLLAINYHADKIHKNDTLTEVLQAPDREELIDWLAHRPLLVYDHHLEFVMTHAGLAPHWTLAKAQLLAKEIETVLQSDDRYFFLNHLYGNDPNLWHDDLSGMERLRCITNYFTRMRFCHSDGSLNLTYKGDIQHKPSDLIPWYEIKKRANQEIKIIFGHWAALNGEVTDDHLYPLDTGCIWGRCLTAMRLSDEKRFSVPCTPHPP